MDLFINGIKLNADQEHEMFSTNEFGLTAKVTTINNEVEFYNNLTEIHYICSASFIIFNELRVAFESDLHGTGGTRNLANFKSIEISEATEMAENW